MKKKIICLFLLTGFSAGIFAIDGFFLGFSNGILLKVDIASAFMSKRVVDPQKHEWNSINTGIGEYGVANPHGFPRVLESKVAPYGELIFNWGYKFPKLFTLGFGFLLSSFVMPSLMFNFKFSFLQDKQLQPYINAGVYTGLFDGFPIGLTLSAGFDLYFDKSFYMFFESRLGSEIFVSKYYDDGNNGNPIWHWDSTYAYGEFGLYIGLAYVFKNKYTDENGKWIGKKQTTVK